MRFDDPCLIFLAITFPCYYPCIINYISSFDVKAETWTIWHYYVESFALSLSMSWNYSPALRTTIRVAIEVALTSRLIFVLWWFKCSIFEVENEVGSWALWVGLNFPGLILCSMIVIDDEFSFVTLTTIEPHFFILCWEYSTGLSWYDIHAYSCPHDKIILDDMKR